MPPRKQHPIERPTVTLEHFDLLKHCTNEQGCWKSPLSIWYGYRGTGKSTKIVSYLYETRHIYGSAHRFSPTADIPQIDGTLVFGRIFPRCCCWLRPTLELLEGIEQFQDWITKCRPAGIRESDLPCLVLLDDLSAERRLVNSEKMMQWACRCRHCRITLVIAIQFFNHLNTTFRQNCDFFVTNAERSGTTKKKLFEEIFSMFGSYPAFIRALETFTDNYGSLVWCNAGAAKQKVDQCCFFYECAEMDIEDAEGNITSKRVTGDDFSLTLRIQQKLNELFGKSEDEMKKEWTDQAASNMPWNKSSTVEADEANVDEVSKKGAAEFVKKPRRKTFKGIPIEDEDDPMLDEEARIQAEEYMADLAKEKAATGRKKKKSHVDDVEGGLPGYSDEEAEEVNFKGRKRYADPLSLVSQRIRR